MANNLPKGYNTSVYPQPIPEKGTTDQRHSTARGLTLLDHLAIAALPVAAECLQERKQTARGDTLILWSAAPKLIVSKAYDIAEAMLIERAARLDGKDSAATV